MRDVDNARAAIPEPPHDCEQSVGLALRKRCGGLVQNQHPHIRTQRLGDFDQLLFRHRKRTRHSVRIDVGSDDLDQFSGARTPRRPIDPTEQSTRLVNKRDVLRDSEIREDCRLLIDRRDTHMPRPMRRIVLQNFTVELHRTRVRLHRAGQDPDERALPRSVFANQGMHFARAKVERNVLERAHAAVAFFDAFRLKQQLAIILAT